MDRKIKEPLKSVISFRVPERIAQLIRRWAEEEEVPVSWIARKIFLRAVREMERQRQETKARAPEE